LNIFFLLKSKTPFAFIFFCVCAFYHKSKDEIEEKNVQI